MDVGQTISTDVAGGSSDQDADVNRNHSQLEDEVRNILMKHRIATYKNWPVSFLSPNVMAAAGFYYTGQIDRVRCLSCRTEVCRWEEGDDPVEEHIKWGGRCAYLKNSKHKSFVCKICFDKEVGIACLPCGHCFMCKNCSKNINKCAICRVECWGKLKIYL